MRAQRPLPRDRGAEIQTAAAANRPAGKADRQAPKPPPSRFGKGSHYQVGLALHARPPPTGPSRSADSPRSPSQNTAPVSYQLAMPPVRRGGIGVAQPPHTLFSQTRRAASVTAPPLPIARALRTTVAPAASARAPVPSEDPSSATHSEAPGNVADSAVSVAAPMRSGLIVGSNYYEDIRGHDRLATTGIVLAVSPTATPPTQARDAGPNGVPGGHRRG